MAIMQSCCCWRSLRKGSYASAAYTAGYFTVIVIIMSNFVHEERHYWSGNTTVPHSHSFLEPGNISPTTMTFNLVALVCACLGVLTCLLLVYAIYTDQRIYLVPWIFTLGLTTIVDLTHSVYMFALETMNFNPMTAILFTMDFFLLCLNVYCLLCVISQYQEYKAGRGTAEFDNRAPPVRYLASSTEATVSSRRVATYHETQSPTQAHSTFPEESYCPPPPTLRRPSKKHVQFGAERTPDYLRVHWKGESDIQQKDTVSNTASSWENNEPCKTVPVDTEPLIHTLNNSIQQNDTN
ncbi:uncharacterized protein LOC142328905 [Lycorma delicatula]|uniref:uncharacterized protein LOC142328905 n=1 Tax=Lycorma delicatula TaxID=130591 RepID=UPI003F51975A